MGMIRNVLPTETKSKSWLDEAEEEDACKEMDPLPPFERYNPLTPSITVQPEATTSSKVARPASEQRRQTILKLGLL